MGSRPTLGKVVSENLNVTIRAIINDLKPPVVELVGFMRFENGCVCFSEIRFDVRTFLDMIWCRA